MYGAAVAQKVERGVCRVRRVGGSISKSSCPCVFGTTLNPELVPMGRPASCMAAPTPSVCEWVNKRQITIILNILFVTLSQVFT